MRYRIIQCWFTFVSTISLSAFAGFTLLTFHSNSIDFPLSGEAVIVRL